MLGVVGRAAAAAAQTARAADGGVAGGAAGCGLRWRRRRARRFPQPVRVGVIVGQDLLQPVEAQPVLGRVAAVRLGDDGRVAVVVRTGGLLGFGGRLVAVPADAVAYLGPQLALVGYTAEQLAGLPTAEDGPALPGDATIRLGIVKPFHWRAAGCGPGRIEAAGQGCRIASPPAPKPEGVGGLVGG